MPLLYPAGRMAGGLYGSSLWGYALFEAGMQAPAAAVTPTVAASGWTSADLLRKFFTMLGRGNAGNMQADNLWTQDRGFEFLADAQEDVYSDLAPICPAAFVLPPVLLTSSDGGVTYDFPSYPYGHVEVYGNSAAGWQLLATSYDNVQGDFVIERGRLRSPNGKARHYTNGPWARFTSFPLRIDAATEPSIDPPPARSLILYRALVSGCDAFGATTDPSTFEKRYTEVRKRYITFWQTQYNASPSKRRLGDAWWLRLEQMNG